MGGAHFEGECGARCIDYNVTAFCVERQYLLEGIAEISPKEVRSFGDEKWG